MNRFAMARFSGDAAIGASKRTDVSPANEMTLNVSFGLSPSSDRRTASFAFSIGNPSIEPEVSITKTISFGVMS